MQKIIETDGLIFIKPSLDLVEDYLIMANDKEVQKYISKSPKTYTYESESEQVKNKLNNKTEIMNKAKKNYISDISANIKEGDQLSLYCILDYLINRYNITNKEELIEILSNLNLIANSSNMLSYEKMKRNVANFEENDVSNFVKPLIIALNSINLNYEENEARSYEKKEVNSCFDTRFDYSVMDLRFYSEADSMDLRNELCEQTLS